MTSGWELVSEAIIEGSVICELTPGPNPSSVGWRMTTRSEPMEEAVVGDRGSALVSPAEAR